LEHFRNFTKKWIWRLTTRPPANKPKKLKLRWRQDRRQLCLLPEAQAPTDLSEAR
jgi:hypothetical protein